jgi:hypothetical protein
VLVLNRRDGCMFKWLDATFGYVKLGLNLGDRMVMSVGGGDGDHPMPWIRNPALPERTPRTASRHTAALPPPNPHGQKR